MKSSEKLEILRSIASEGEDGARRFLENYGLEGKFPVNIVELIERVGINIIPYDFSRMEKSEEYAKKVIQKGKILGAVAVNECNIGIFVDQTCHTEELQLALAHEFAYCCLCAKASSHRSHVDFRSDILGEKTVPLKTDIFAECLLMPKRDVKYVHSRLTIPYISSFAKIFGVPENVACSRLKRLGLNYYTST